jgi:hypothetical protein
MPRNIKINGTYVPLHGGSWDIRFMVICFDLVLDHYNISRNLNKLTRDDRCLIVDYAYLTCSALKAIYQKGDYGE